jgi:hypothetical protein
VLWHDGDPRKPWKSKQIDAFPTAHHIACADIDGDGKKELINAPLVGETNREPKYEGPTPMFFYRVPKDWSGEWKRETITTDYKGIIHRVRVMNWNPKDKREQLQVTGFEGIVTYTASGHSANLKWDRRLIVKGHDSDEAPRLGTSDFKIGHLGKQWILAAVEPWHGNEVVVYTEDSKGGRQRQVIYDALTEGHEVCIGDLMATAAMISSPATAPRVRWPVRISSTRVKAGRGATKNWIISACPRPVASWPSSLQLDTRRPDPHVGVGESGGRRCPLSDAANDAVAELRRSRRRALTKLTTGANGSPKWLLSGRGCRRSIPIAVGFCRKTDKLYLDSVYIAKSFVSETDSARVRSLVSGAMSLVF